MNILFVNYGDFTTNSLNHIGGFANWLSAQGHACIVAVPDKKETISVIPNALFAPATFDEVLAGTVRFLDGRGADVLHAWTPREGVRKFVVNYQRQATTPARVVVHLEDNEAHLFAAYHGTDPRALAAQPAAEVLDKLIDPLPNPLRVRGFLSLADGMTYITPRLREHVPNGVPAILLPPGVDFAFYHPQDPDPAWRDKLGLGADERVVVLTGSNTFANEAEIRELYLAVALLNERGFPTRLVRTGFNSPQFLATLAPAVQAHVIDLGFVPKTDLPQLLALADVLVQPGHPGVFNDFRLPSKLPEFLAAGRPVVLPDTNLASEMVDGEHALFLHSSTPDEIADRCEAVFRDPALAERLGRNGHTLARRYFDLATNSATLAAFYHQVQRAPARTSWTRLQASGATDLSLLPFVLLANAHDPAQSAELTEQFSAVLRLEETRLLQTQEALQRERSTLAATAQHASNLEQKIHNLETHAAQLEAHVRTLEESRRLSSAHIQNIEQALAANQQEHATYRELTTAHVHNLEGLTRQLQQELERAHQSALQQVANTEKALELARGELNQTQSTAGQLRLQLAETERVARERVDDMQRRLDHTLNDLAHARAVVASREQKIRKLERSFSWQVTLPLRALRRWLIDPKRPRKTAPVAPLATATPHRVVEPTPATQPPANAEDAPPSRSAYTYNFDHPRQWRTTSNKLLILGWCFENGAAAIKGIRAHFCGTITEGIYGSKRLDVMASVGGRKQAEHCGIKLELRTALGEQPLRIELLHEDGWHPFFETIVHVGEPGDPGERSDYEKWCEQHEALSADDEKAIFAHIDGFEERPLISVVMPTYNPPAELLEKAIASVQQQIYPHWELCVADDCSTQPHVRRILETAAAKDPRIKLHFRETNGHISRASNSAIELATGSWLALFDHDDVLHRTALYFVAAEINAHPDAELIYTDEDKIDGEDRRFDPYFKPDWNPDLYHGQNFTSHLSVFRTERVREVGGFRTGYEGSQDWDLTLRVVEQIAPQSIRHIPRILYHWRAIPGSTALQLAEKSYPVDAARRALLDHFERTGERIELLTVPGDHWRIKYPLPDTPPLVSLIIPTRNALKLVRQAVESVVAKTTYPRYEILIVDNNSDDAMTLAWFREVERTSSPAIRVVPYPGPFNYSAINNFAVRQAAGEVVGLLNNDVEVINPDWLEELVSHALRPGIGAVGAMLYYPMNTVQHAGVVLGLGGVAGHPFKEFPRNDQGQKNRLRLVQNYSAVTGACLVVRKDRFLEVGGLDEASLPVAFNDVDFCCKLLRAGYRNVWTPFAELYHHESATRGVEDTPEKKARFQGEIETMMKRWPELLAHDPAYNPNLTLVGEDFSAAYLPRLTKPWREARASAATALA